jgi:hypothetical protein
MISHVTNDHPALGNGCALNDLMQAKFTISLGQIVPAMQPVWEAAMLQLTSLPQCIVALWFAAGGVPSNNALFHLR